MTQSGTIPVRDLSEGGWFRIDNAVLWEYGSALGAHGIAVYNVLALHANRDQECWPGIQQIADLAGLSRRQVFRELDKLEDLGLIVRQRRIVQGKNEKDTNLYKLLSVSKREGELDKGSVSQARPSATQAPGRATQAHKQDVGNKTQITTTTTNAPEIEAKCDTLKVEQVPVENPPRIPDTPMPEAVVVADPSDPKSSEPMSAPKHAKVIHKKSSLAPNSALPPDIVEALQAIHFKSHKLQRKLGDIYQQDPERAYSFVIWAKSNGRKPAALLFKALQEDWTVPPIEAPPRDPRPDCPKCQGYGYVAAGGLGGGGWVLCPCTQEPDWSAMLARVLEDDGDG